MSDGTQSADFLKEISGRCANIDNPVARGAGIDNPVARCRHHAVPPVAEQVTAAEELADIAGGRYGAVIEQSA